MGYTRRTLKLVFEDEQYAGLEVQARPMSIDQVEEYTSLTTDEATTKAEAIGRLLGPFAENMLGWNMEEPDGSPVPATLAGLRTFDMPFLWDLLKAWARASAGVSRPLPSGSSDGPSSDLETSITMETLPLSLPNSSEPGGS